MSTSASASAAASTGQRQQHQRYVPLYAASIASERQRRTRIPPLRRAATFLLSRAGLASASLSRNPHWSELKPLSSWHLGGGTRSSSRQLLSTVWAAATQESGSGVRPVVRMVKPSIQFIRGVDELVVPDISLTRSQDQRNGVATFVFDQPSVFDSSREMGEITGIYMIDDEGVLQSVDVSAKFVNGKPAKIEAKYVMRNIGEWDRFMRFMERYAAENNLGFVKK
ncbi:photosystem II reaction center PSB28 protein, chloroplastic [Selaginella moellendorffii]|nr:photosystem II reaction center PSB28 protein, chloroplastic [Selaginella moellendorffii]|eukprot:XP_002977960.2 photosystem II reaction center PSB28 protein, chloroplastic [Selaginella moellendorffii]